MDKDIVLLDFCGTVADFQTFDPYIEYVLTKAGIPAGGVSAKFLKLTDIFFSKIGCSINAYKKHIIRKTSGIEESFMEECAIDYYRDKVSRHFVPDTIKLINQLKADGYMIVIVSAACEPYVRLFAKDFGVEHVIANKIAFKDGKSEGRLERADCIGDRKTDYLKKYFDDNKLSGSYKICITDSKSDLPIISLCEKAYIISHDDHQKWIGEGMEEIIWH